MDRNSCRISAKLDSIDLLRYVETDANLRKLIGKGAWPEVGEVIRRHEMEKNGEECLRFHGDLNRFRNAWMPGFIGNTIDVFDEYVPSAEKISWGQTLRQAYADSAVLWSWEVQTGG
jgi:hypothetical protein